MQTVTLTYVTLKNMVCVHRFHIQLNYGFLNADIRTKYPAGVPAIRTKFFKMALPDEDVCLTARSENLPHETAMMY